MKRIPTRPRTFPARKKPAFRTDFSPEGEVILTPIKTKLEVFTDRLGNIKADIQGSGRMLLDDLYADMMREVRR